jgi:uncharacterized protein with HEPN domain
MIVMPKNKGKKETQDTLQVTPQIAKLPIITVITGVLSNIEKIKEFRKKHNDEEILYNDNLKRALIMRFIELAEIMIFLEEANQLLKDIQVNHENSNESLPTLYRRLRNNLIHQYPYQYYQGDQTFPIAMLTLLNSTLAKVEIILKNICIQLKDNKPTEATCQRPIRNPDPLPLDTTMGKRAFEYAKLEINSCIQMLNEQGLQVPYLQSNPTSPSSLDEIKSLQDVLKSILNSDEFTDISKNYLLNICQFILDAQYHLNKASKSSIYHKKIRTEYYNKKLPNTIRSTFHSLKSQRKAIAHQKEETFVLDYQTFADLLICFKHLEQDCLTPILANWNTLYPENAQHSILPSSSFSNSTASVASVNDSHAVILSSLLSQPSLSLPSTSLSESPAILSSPSDQHSTPLNSSFANSTIPGTDSHAVILSSSLQPLSSSPSLSSLLPESSTMLPSPNNRPLKRFKEDTQSSKKTPNLVRQRSSGISSLVQSLRQSQTTPTALPKPSESSHSSRGSNIPTAPQTPKPQHSPLTEKTIKKQDDTITKSPKR